MAKNSSKNIPMGTDTNTTYLKQHNYACFSPKPLFLKMSRHRAKLKTWKSYPKPKKGLKTVLKTFQWAQTLILLI